MDNDNIGINDKDVSWQKVVLFLNRIGMFPNLKGYTYLLTAVNEIIKEPSLMYSITKVLYPKIASIFSTTPNGVERGIRNAIEVTCNKGKLYMVANTYYNGNFTKYEKPTNGEFIAFLVCLVNDFNFIM